MKRNSLGWIGAALATFCLLPPAHAAKNKLPKATPSKVKLSVPAPVLLEAWPGQRIVMLLPLTLGDTWNADANFGRAILPEAAQVLEGALQATGKLSVIEPYRFNPILQRAQQEGRITREQLTALVKAPTLENARIVMAKLDPSFDQPPLIGQFSLEELRLTGSDKDTRAQVQVAGRLYELSGATAAYSAVITSDTVSANRTTGAVLGAAGDAFSRLAREFTKPVSEPVLTTSASAPATPQTPAPVQPAMPVAQPAPQPPVVMPPDVAPAAIPEVTAPAGGARDIVPKLPAAEPPLDINVPNR